MTVPRACVVIPTLRPGPALPRLVAALRSQTSPPEEILVLDSSSGDGTAEQARALGCRVEVIPRSSFDHGGTRDLGAQLTAQPYIVYMTQDALPAHPEFIAELIRPLQSGSAAAYARQLPRPGATPLERFHRAFNYPPEGHVRQAADLERLGLRAAFFSNVASAIDRLAYEAVGGFPSGVIFNEDMILACRLLRAGYQVAYAADAQVYHSHAYRLAQQFRRYFDIGASHLQARGELHRLPAAREGLRFARAQSVFLVRHGAWTSLPRAGLEAAAKWLAFQIGRRARRFPRSLCARLSLQPGFWLRPPAARAVAGRSA